MLNFMKRPNYIRQWRKHRGMTQEQLAAEIGSATASISQIETGKQGFTDSTLYAIADALAATPGDLLSRSPTDDIEPAEIPVMGYVGAGAEVEPDFEQVPPDGLFSITVPFPMPADMIAYQVRGDSMLPQFQDGMIIVVFRDQRRSTDSFLGEEAVVRTEDGRRFVKTIERGADGGYTLRSWNAKPIERVSLDWVGEIFTYLPAAALKRESRRIEKNGGIQGQLRLKAG